MLDIRTKKTFMMVKVLFKVIIVIADTRYGLLIWNSKFVHTKFPTHLLDIINIIGIYYVQIYVKFILNWGN